jgi:hypothetical protein
MKQRILNWLALQVACWSVGMSDGNAISRIFLSAMNRIDPGWTALEAPAINGHALRPRNEMSAIVSNRSPIDRSEVPIIVATGSSSALSHALKHTNGSSMMAEPIMISDRSETEPHRADDGLSRLVRHRRDREIPNSKKPRRSYLCVRPKSNRRLAHANPHGRTHGSSGK